MELPDPPVWVAHARFVTDEEGEICVSEAGIPVIVYPRWELEADHISDFLIGMAYLNACFLQPCCNRENEMYLADEQAAEKIRSLFKRKCSPTKSWMDGGVEFFALHIQDALILMRNDGIYEVYFAALEERVLKEMNALLLPLVGPYGQRFRKQRRKVR